jgi:hypothetical protein
MKKALTLASTLSAIISIQPVFAVDYVACREMLRTKNEMIYLAKEKDIGYEEAHIYPKCPAYIKEKEKEKKELKDFASNPWDSIKQKNIDTEIKSYPLITWDNQSGMNKKDKPIQSADKSLTGIMIDCLLKAKSYNTDFGSFYSREAIGFAKGAEKVLRDMHKAKCPYE